MLSYFLRTCLLQSIDLILITIFVAILTTRLRRGLLIIIDISGAYDMIGSPYSVPVTSR